MAREEQDNNNDNENGHEKQWNGYYKVNFSNNKPFMAKFRSDLKETFFPDDPNRHAKGKDTYTKTYIVAKNYINILEWGPKYNFSKFRSDLLSGITIASLAIPQGISYAKLANLPPIIGLYSSFVPPLVYAIFGSSMNLAVGTVAAASLLLQATISEHVTYDKDPDLYVKLMFTAAFVTGVFQLTMGIFRLGILVDFLSRSTITGFMGGTAIIIILQQLKGLLGLVHFTTKTDVVTVLRTVFERRDEWRWESAVVGAIFIFVLLVSKHIRNKTPRLFWVPAIAPLTIVILGGIFAYLVHGENHGIQIVGDLKKGLSPISIGDLQFHNEFFGSALKAGIITGFLALSEGIAVGRSLALLKNEQIDGNKEMIGFGLMNIVGSFFSCYLTTGPFSKSVVNYHAGCKTPMSNMVQAICVMLVLLFLAPYFKYTPLVALSAIIVVAMIGLIEYEEVYHLYKVDKFDFVICMSALLGVAFLSMKYGLMISVGLSVIRALLYIARPTTCKLGNLEGSDVYRDVEQYRDSVKHQDMMILKVGSPVYFANAGYLRERITRFLEEEDTATKKVEVQYIILDLGGVTAIDNSGLNMLIEIHKNLKKMGIKIAIVNPRFGVAEKLFVSKFIDLIGKEWVFLTVKEAVTAWHFNMLESTRHKTETIQ